MHTTGEVTEDNEKILSSGCNFLDLFKLQHNVDRLTTKGLKSELCKFVVYHQRVEPKTTQVIFFFFVLFSNNSFHQD